MPPEQLDKELLYNYLAGEISVRRGAWESAYDHLMAAAREAKDPVAASKAARLAWRQGDMEKAASATIRWIEYDPNSLAARQLALLHALRTDDLSGAMEQAQAIIKIADALGKDGFLLLGSALASAKGDTKIELMKTLVREHPENAHAHYALALVASQEKRFDQALAAVDEANRLAPDWDIPYLLRVQIYAMQGEEATAEEALSSAAQKHPKAATIQEAYGRLLMQQKRYAEALERFQMALKQKPQDHELLYLVGILALQVENWELARSTWERLRDDPRFQKQDEAQYFLGQLEELQGNLDQAINNYRQVKGGKLKHDALLRIAILTGRLGKLQESKELFRNLRITAPQQAAQTYITEAEMLKDLGKIDQALNIYTEAIRTYPNNADLRYARGLLAADMGKVDLAERDFKAVLKIKPDDTDTLNALGYTLADLTRRYQEAFQYISAAYKRDPDSPAILDSMGWVLYRLGRTRESLKFLRQAARKLDDPEIAAHLGEVLWATGAREEARKTWEQAIERHPDSKKLRQTAQRFL
ncbi:tetratricopeptide repeat protein [Thiolapillus brandeum]|uniref:tetratricopeptide repeat protein n=1 Tax=Thiolapillus brandeum TaxID=1076588 RepID=UPI00155A39AC|nr:tetratricopeptide repeat protein [Thiolapillus brandeum]